ncbi:MAG: hypothetical protein HZB46_07650, partial [Solirubrobacterales bacterium]|nr:hypothetical protein [Solirubrobacterales bacterium]
MSVEAVLARIAELDQALNPQRARQAAAPQGTSFAGVLGSASSILPASTTALTGGTPGLRALQAAQAEVGVAEQPPGSNDSPRIAQYREATAGSGVGPWCAYFTSWAAAQAGVPLGEA